MPVECFIEVAERCILHAGVRQTLSTWDAETDVASARTTRVAIVARRCVERISSSENSGADSTRRVGTVSRWARRRAEPAGR